MAVGEGHLTGRPLAGQTVLVAEDDPFIADEIRDVLALEGAQVLGPVPTVRAAMAAIAAETPHAAVLDVNLQGRELGARRRRAARDGCAGGAGDRLHA